MKTLLGVVVVSFRTPSMLHNLLSTLEQDPEVAKIVVVENSSNDGSAEMVRSSHPKVQLLEPGTNLGFARAVNLGLQHLPDYHVLLINPDCTLGPATIHTLLEHLRAHDRCGIAAPLTVHPSMRLGIIAAGRQPTISAIAKHYSGISALFPNQSWAEGWHLRARTAALSAREVEWVSGGCMLVRAQTIREVGPLSEEWFMYAEDMELCRRARAAGWEVWHVPRALVSHVIGASSSGSVNTRWVSVLIDYHKRHLTSWPASTYLYRLVLGAGLLSRAAFKLLRAARADGTTSDYRQEAVKNWRWARAAFFPETYELQRVLGSRPGKSASHSSVQSDV